MKEGKGALTINSIYHKLLYKNLVRLTLENFPISLNMCRDEGIFRVDQPRTKEDLRLGSCWEEELRTVSMAARECCSKSFNSMEGTV